MKRRFCFGIPLDWFAKNRNVFRAGQAQKLARKGVEDVNGTWLSAWRNKIGGGWS